MFLPASELQTVPKMSVKKCEVKKRLRLKKCLLKNVALAVKLLRKSKAKSKATESSQGRAQSWWTSSRVSEARVQCRWQGNVAWKLKNVQCGKTATKTNIIKTSWRFPQAKYHCWEFCWFHLRSKLSHLKRTKAPLKRKLQRYY